MSNIIILELGDIIDIKIDEPSTSPNKTDKMETVLITYIDEERLGLTNLDTGQRTNLPLAENRIVTKYGKQVTEIHLLSRNPLKGYALQNGLTTGKHIRVNFAGVPEKLEGEILETKNDMVTLLANDTFEILYLNFAYQGLPKNENFEIISILLVPPNNQQEKKKETLTQKIYNYLENHPAFQEQETGTQTISVNEVSRKMIDEVEALEVNMLPWICRVIRNYIEMINHSEHETSRESVVVKEEEGDAEKENKPVDEPVIGISPKVEMRLLEDIHSADQLLRNEGILPPRISPVNTKGRKNKKGKKLRRRKKGLRQHKTVVAVAEGDPESEAGAGAELPLVENMDVPNQSTSHSPLLVEQIQAIVEDFYTNMSKEITLTDQDDLQHILQRYSQLYHSYIAYPPKRNPLFESLKHFNQSIGWMMPVVAQNIVSEKNFLEKLQETEQQFEDPHNRDPHRYPTYLTTLDNLFDPSSGEPPSSSDCLLHETAKTNLPVLASTGPTKGSYADTLSLSPTIYLPSESFCLVSMLTFPFSVMRYSRVYTPLTTLYETTGMIEGTQGLKLFEMLAPANQKKNPLLQQQVPDTVIQNHHSSKNKTEKKRSQRRKRGGLTRRRDVPVIHTVYVGKDQSHGHVDKEKINNYTLLDGEEPNNLDDLLQSVVNHEMNVERYLQAIPLHTRGIGFSIYQLSRQLEPFQLYYDRLTVKQHNILGQVLTQRSKQYRKDLHKTIQIFKSLETSKLSSSRASAIASGESSSSKSNYLQELAQKDENFVTLLKSVYEQFTPTTNTPRGVMLSSLSREELLTYMTCVDGGEFFNFCLSASKLDSNIVREKEVPYAYSNAVKISQGNSNVYVPPIPPNPSLNPLEATLSTKEGTPPSSPSSSSPSSSPSSSSSPPSSSPSSPSSPPSSSPSSPSPSSSPSSPPPSSPPPSSSPPSPDQSVTLPPHVSKVTVLPLGTTGKEYCKTIEVVKIYIYRDDLIEDNDRTVMTTLLPSLREVKNGDHAILLQGGPEAVSYFLRENNRWREDVTIRPLDTHLWGIQTQLLYETPAMVCNMKLESMRDFTNKKCVSMKALSKYMVQKSLSETTPQVSYRFLEYLQKNELKQIERSRGIVSLYDRSRLVYDHQQFQLGLTRRTFELVHSPYQVLFFSILTEKNFDKRQHEILNFCMCYTRPHDPHNNLESSYWRYCVTKAIPLVPTSLYLIATLYLRTLENFPEFVEGMEQIKATFGTISEDQTFIVDKHTGFKIVDNPLENSKRFCYREETRKPIQPVVDWNNNNNNIIQPEEEEEGGGRYPRKEDTKIIRSIVQQVSKKLGIQLTKDEPFIVRNVLYKIPPTSDEAERNKVRLYLTLGMMVIAIQTSMPNVISVKTAPHCKAVYLGYPLLENPEEMGTIDYVACGVIKAKRKKDRRWKGVSTSIDRNEYLIQLAIDTELRQLPEVQWRINEKRQQIEIMRENDHPHTKNKYLKKHSLQEWTTFLPAQLQTNPNLKVVNALHKTDRDTIMDIPTSKGLDLYVSKMDEYTLGLEEEIQEIVRQEAPPQTNLLENSYCCRDIVTNSAIKYFTNKKQIISTYLHGAADLNDRLDHLVRTSKARPMISGINTKREYPQEDTGFSEHIWYAAFVYQAKQDIRQGLADATHSEDTSSSSSSFLENNGTSESGSSQPVAKGKKNLVKILDTLEENIDRLKNANINYTKTQFEDLLKNRFKEGIVPKKEIFPDVPNVQKLSGVIAEIVALLDLGLTSEKSELFSSRPEEGEGEGEGEGGKAEKGVSIGTPPILSQTFITHVLSAMNQKPKGLSTYLSHANEAFMKNMRKTWSSWKSPKEVDMAVSSLGKAFNSNTFSTFEMFLDRTQEFIENITQVYPSIILNKKKINVEKISLPTCWEISSQDEEQHLKEIMAEKYDALQPLYGNQGLEQILEKMKKVSRPLVFLMKKIRSYYYMQQQQQQQPVTSPTPTPSNKKSTSAPPVLLNADAMNLLFKYFVYTIYDQYHLLGEGVVEVAVVDQMMELFFQLFVEDKELLNQVTKPPPLDNLVISRKQRAKRKQVHYWASLSKEERQVHKVLRRNRIGPFQSSSSANDFSGELYFDNEEDPVPTCVTFESEMTEDFLDFATDTDDDTEYENEDEDIRQPSAEEEEDMPLSNGSTMTAE
jgi:hypothetical protein